MTKINNWLLERDYIDFNDTQDNYEVDYRIPEKTTRNRLSELEIALNTENIRTNNSNIEWDIIVVWSWYTLYYSRRYPQWTRLTITWNVINLSPWDSVKIMWWTITKIYFMYKR